MAMFHQSIYPLVMTFTVRHGFSMALIEIDGLPFLIAWWIFPWRTGKVITRWYLDGFYIAQLRFTPWDAAKKFGFSRYWGLDMDLPSGQRLQFAIENGDL